MFTQIVVGYIPTPEGLAALDAAIALAKEGGGHLTGASPRQGSWRPTRSSPSPSRWGPTSWSSASAAGHPSASS